MTASNCTNSACNKFLKTKKIELLSPALLRGFTAVSDFLGYFKKCLKRILL
jgi:hypothetical protein